MGSGNFGAAVIQTAASAASLMPKIVQKLSKLVDEKLTFCLLYTDLGCYGVITFNV